MASDLYWVSAASYAAVLIIILINDIRVRRKVNEVEKSFQVMVMWVIFFCLQDIIWGMCENHVIDGDTQFFISSTVFHISTVITTFFWLNYVLTYLREKLNIKRLLLAIDGFVIIFEVFLVVANLFTPTLFEIKNGEYITGPVRPLTFVNQYLVYLTIGIVTFVLAIKEQGKKRDRYITVCIFELVPILLGVFQLKFPDAPFFSMSYFLGCFIVHIFIVTKDRQEAERNGVLKSIADTYYSMHLIDLERDTIERLISSDIIERIIKDDEGARESVEHVFAESVCDEYLDIVLDFVDLSTLSDRMGNNNLISCEFVGKFHGWTRVSFVSVEKEAGRHNKVMIITQIIDAEKRRQIDLLFKSNNDELTGLYNRRAFEIEIQEMEEKPKESTLVFVSMDVNGLKVVNDSLGHVAGDELLVGAAQCMKKCFGAYGKVFRTGGDEFCAIIYATKIELDIIQNDFNEMIEDWSGINVSQLSVSCGYVTAEDMADCSLHDAFILADKKMYAAKEQHYKTKGIDRRGQKDAHVALYGMYTKILKINITKDTYQIIDMAMSEKAEEKGFSDKISEWLADFGKSGKVHPDDLEEYLEKTNLSYMSEYFKHKKNSLGIVYRRKLDDAYKQVLMEIIPSNEYADDNQSLFLYVKNIDK